MWWFSCVLPLLGACHYLEGERASTNGEVNNFYVEKRQVGGGGKNFMHAYWRIDN